MSDWEQIAVRLVEGGVQARTENQVIFVFAAAEVEWPAAAFVVQNGRLAQISSDTFRHIPPA